MIAALIIGRKGSVGFPGKNTFPVLGKPLCYYPMQAALKSKNINQVFVSTDDEKIMEIAIANGIKIIHRPPELCTKEALGEHVFLHGYQQIKDQAQNQVEFLVLLFCNAATVTFSLIDQGIEILRKSPDADSAVTVSKYNMWSPLRARKINSSGLLDPFVRFETFGDPQSLNCDRDSQGDVWFADMGASIVRPRCLENMSEGLLPQKWMGKKIVPLKQWGGCDVDYEWQIPQVEYWLKKNGY